MAEKKFRYVAVGKPSGVWAAEKADGALRFIGGDGGGINWFHDAIGKADAIALSDSDNVWCVNEAGQIWYRTPGELPYSGVWAQIATASGQDDAKTISVGNDGTVWYAQKDGRLFRRVGDSWREDDFARAESVAVFDRFVVWIINKQGQLWQLATGGWSQMGAQDNAKTIAVGQSGFVAYADTDGTIYYRALGEEAEVWHKGWDQRSMGKAAVLAVGHNDTIWCLNTAGEVWYSTNGSWVQFTGYYRGDMITRQYTIKQGDQLNVIVMREYGITDAAEINRIVDRIVVQNGIEDKDEIDVGQVLMWDDGPADDHGLIDALGWNQGS
ncbi:MAG: tectonin domain-containing protein [Chloroflexota bacterium]